MLLNEGDFILVAHRRLFDKDDVRFFVGRVDAYEMGIVKASGHTFVREHLSGKVIEKAEPRTKLLSVSSGTLIVYQLPDDTSFDTLKLAMDGGRLVLSDGRRFRMNLMESATLGQM